MADVHQQVLGDSRQCWGLAYSSVAVGAKYVKKEVAQNLVMYYILFGILYCGGARIYVLWKVDLKVCRMSHTVGHKLPTALSDAASLALSGLRREVSLSATSLG